MIPNILFPIGHVAKHEVRRIAQKANLFTATKKDSQGICFLGDVDMKKFLQHYIEEKRGDVVTKEGVVVGHHAGVWFYTLGERHGFTITEHSTERKPYYIIGKNIENNTLIVGHEVYQIHNTAIRTIYLREENWFTDIKADILCTAQIRYHGKFFDAKVLNKGCVELVTDELISLGQSLVLYHHNTLLGGGVIDSIQ